ncbi:MAG: hypothetical protein GXO91_00065 [FCB group bacterium]|nr:hypothetical protein [FCB group bacterium]
MLSPRQNFKGHGFAIFRASFLLAALLSISQMQVDFPPLSLTPDQTGESTFYFAASNPLILADIQDGPLLYDGSLNLPLGSFLIRANPLQMPPDSLANRTFFDYSQGDYGYHDITLGNEAALASGGRLYFIGAGRSFSGQYGNLGPENSDRNTVLQNYQLRYESPAGASGLVLGLQYHFENTGLPVTAGGYENRREESFHFGGSYERMVGRTEMSLRTAFQSGKYSAYGKQFDAFTLWNRLKLKRPIRADFSGYMDLQRKSVALQFPEAHEYRNRFTQLNTGISWRRKTVSASFGTAFIAKKFYLTGEVIWEQANLSLSLRRFVENNLSADSILALQNNPYPASEVALQIKWSGISGKLSLGQLDWTGDQIPLARYDIGIDWRWFQLEFTGSYVGSDHVLFDYRLGTALRLDPEIPGKRYRPFLELRQSYTHFTGYAVPDLTRTTAFAPFYGGYFTTNDLSFQIGFDIHNFRFTYHMDHLLPEGLTYSPELLPVEQLNYFQVLWIFEN